MKHTTNSFDMKKLIVVLVLLLSCNLFGMAQNSSENNGNKNKYVFYSAFANYLPDGFDFPGIGLVNVARGNHSTAYIGLMNYADRLSGTQIGLVNTAKQLSPGVQIGLVNTRLSGEKKAVQIALINTNVSEPTGVQIGLVNVSSGRINGLQLGLINYSDTVSGVPLGLISVVRKGGYRALEVSLSEIAPINASFKLGVEKLYTSFNLAYNPGAEQKIMFGMGVGSIISLKNQFFFNPEISQMNTLSTKKHSFQQFLRAVPAFGFQYKRMNIIAGPSVCYSYTKKDEILNQPFMQILGHEFDSHKRITVGIHAGIRVVL
ncbi:MAG: hypothetical protein LBS05_11350 [Tannerellaceae bacterium]|jgi:hypothetical protein|nr:hypothetical protein [Tannerellaceae bacterium]